MDYQRAIVEAAVGWAAARTARRLVVRDLAAAKRQRHRVHDRVSDAELRRLEGALRTAWRAEGEADRRLEIAVTGGSRT